MKFTENYKRTRLQVDLSGQTKRVDTSHGNDTDVNKIVARFARTGQLPTNPIEPQYADVTGLQGDLTEMIEKGKDAQKELTELENANQAKIKEQAEKNAKDVEANKARIEELETLLKAQTET